MKDSYELADGSGAAIVCQHVADEGCPILSAFKDAPVEPTDSGWQFLCGSDEHQDESKFQVWSRREITDFEPSLNELVDLPVGSSISRVSPEAPWRIHESTH